MTSNNVEHGTARVGRWWWGAMAGMLFLTGCGGSKPSSAPPAAQQQPADTGPSEEEMKAQAVAEAEQEKLKAIAKERFDVEMAKEAPFDANGVRQRMVMEKFKIDLEKIPAELVDKPQVQKRIREMAQEEARARFSDEQRQKVVLEAEKEFPLYKEGDKVELTTRRGPVSGVLEGIYPDKVKINTLYVLKNDIVTPPPESFDAAVCEKRRNHYVRVHFDISQDDFIAERTKELTPKLFAQCGYLRSGKDWIHVSGLIKERIDPEIATLEKAHRENLESQVRSRVETAMRAEGLIP